MISTKDAVHFDAVFQCSYRVHWSIGVAQIGYAFYL